MKSVSSQYWFILIVTIIFSAIIYPQNSPGSDEQYLAFAQVMPEMEGGMGSLTKLIQYPTLAAKSNVQGKVYAMAFVNEKGTVDRVEIIKGLGAGCDEEVVRVLKGIKFKPGMQEGKPIKVKISVPVTFKLENN